MIKVEHMTPTGRILQPIAERRTSPRDRVLPTAPSRLHWNERSDDWLINGHGCIPVHMYKDQEAAGQDTPRRPEAELPAGAGVSKQALSSTLLGRLAALALIFVVSCRDDPSGDRGCPAPAAGLCRGDARRAAA